MLHTVRLERNTGTPEMGEANKSPHPLYYRAHLF